MGSATLTLRQIALKRSINEHQLENMQISSQKQKLARLSSHIANGVNLSPSSLAGVGIDLFGDALDIMGNASDAATEAAAEMLAAYENAYYTLGVENYNRSGLSAEAALYVDESGNLVTDFAEERFYKQALKDYIEKEIMPLLNEKDSELETLQNQLTTLLQQEEAELQSVEQAKEKAIQREAIKL